jgi:hypothetical protein
MEIHFGESSAQKEDEKIIDRLLRIIEHLTLCPKHGQRNLHLVFYSTTQKNTIMASNSFTLTDLNKHTFVAAVQDSLGNTYQGTLSFTSETPSDPTQDSAVTDPTVANTVDVTALTNTGGTAIAVVASFTSQGNATPATGSTAVAIPDGTVLTVPGTLTIINNVSTTPPPPTLGLSFTQAS